jgi:DNA-binding response OmpR family regulator
MNYLERGDGARDKSGRDPAWSPSADGQAQPAAYDASSAAGSPVVLLAEDEEMVRGLVRSVLEMNGYEVLEASDGEAALRLCREHAGPIDLLLTDMKMPGLGGRELSLGVRAQRPEVRVLFMSGYTEDAALQGGARAAGEDFLAKPFKPAELVRRIKEVLGVR